MQVCIPEFASPAEERSARDKCDRDDLESWLWDHDSVKKNKNKNKNMQATMVVLGRGILMWDAPPKSERRHGAKK